MWAVIFGVVAGEVTFMPLNRLHVRHIDYPNTKDAIAMVSKLEYAEKYDTALRYDNAFIAKACDILKCFMYI